MADVATEQGVRWRVWVHALDRTGPPVLALSFVRWLRGARPGDQIDVLAFRPGDLVTEAAALSRLVTVLDPEEAWDPSRVASGRGDELRGRLADLGPVDVNLLVSVAAGQALPLLGADVGPLVTWVVEVGDDLHWVEPGSVFDGRRTAWIAGSEASATALAALVPDAAGAPVVPEFVDPHPAVDPGAVEACRTAVGAGPSDVVVLGAGIGTRRKGVDLFLEVAAALADVGSIRMVWVGGERDPLWEPVRERAARLGLDHLQLRPNTPDLASWLAAADVFLHTAREDAFPLVCLHAAAAPLPVVALSGTGGVTAMFGDAFAGPPYPDVAGQARVVRDLAGDRAGRIALGERQRVAVSRYLTPVAAPALCEAALVAAGARVAP